MYLCDVHNHSFGTMVIKLTVRVTIRTEHNAIAIEVTFSHEERELENRCSTSSSHEQAKASHMTISFCLIALNKK